MENLQKQMIEYAPILNGQNVLVVDRDDQLVKILKNKPELNLGKITFCDQTDFRTITQYPDDYMNFFDIVLCPSVFYKSKYDNRQLLLQCIVWAMSKKSTLVFAVPNLDNILIGKKQKLDEQVLTVEDDTRYFVVSCSTGIFTSKKEYWHKVSVRYPHQILEVWNTENPNAQFATEGMDTKSLMWNHIFLVDVRKYI